MHLNHDQSPSLRSELRRSTTTRKDTRLRARKNARRRRFIDARDFAVKHVIIGALEAAGGWFVKGVAVLLASGALIAFFTDVVAPLLN